MSSTLFTPYKLGPVTLRNRTIRSAAFESMGKDFGPTRQLKDYHVAVARGGVGMTTLAYAAVCRSGLSFNKQLWLRPEIVPGLREITDAVHREGAAAAIQIGHCGNMTHWTTAGQMPIGASTGFNLYAYTPVRGMKRREIEQVARDFGTAVRTARDAGFDSVEVHAGHGYLISQFLSPYTNHRHDEYGGSLENRLRFPLEISRAIREAVSQDIAVGVRLSATDWVDGGWDNAQSIIFSQQLEALGCDYIHVSSGGLSPHQAIQVGPGYQLPFAREIREKVNIPVIGVGLVTEAQQAEEALQNGDADLIAIARAVLYNPHWPWHAAAALGAQVSVPPQYLRSEPHGLKGTLKSNR